MMRSQSLRRTIAGVMVAMALLGAYGRTLLAQTDCPSAQIQNVNARVYGDPGSGQRTLDFALAPGTYRFTPVSPATDPSAEFTAWNPWDPPTPAWESGVIVWFPASGFSIRLGRIAHYPTPQEAFDDPVNVPVTFELFQSDTARAYVQDFHLGDNQGGVSFRVQAIGPAVGPISDSVSTCLSGSATFGVVAFGRGSLTHRWRKDGLMLDTGVTPSAATATLLLTDLQLTDAGRYDCVVSDDCGSVTSDAATLTVCAADLNCDGVVDFADYLAFLNLFEAGDPRADFNYDGIIDFVDYLEFFNIFDAGC